MTRSRSAVLAALDTATEPLSAGEIALLLAGACDQATVYRALHYLEERDMVESFVLYCSEHGTERYYASGTLEHRHWFHCEACHRFIDLGACNIGGMVSSLERELGISVRRHILYMTGTCSGCASRS